MTDAVADLLFTPSAGRGREPARRGGRRRPHPPRGQHHDRQPGRQGREGPRQRRRRASRAAPTGGYGVVTLHRPSNVDDPASLAASCRRADGGGPAADLPGASAHAAGHGGTRPGGASWAWPTRPLRIVEPLGYYEFMNLVIHARLVLTDSGGLQEETTYLGIPCLTLRPNTERPITIEPGHQRAGHGRTRCPARSPDPGRRLEARAGARTLGRGHGAAHRGRDRKVPGGPLTANGLGPPRRSRSQMNPTSGAGSGCERYRRAAPDRRRVATSAGPPISVRLPLCGQRLVDHPLPAPEEAVGGHAHDGGLAGHGAAAADHQVHGGHQARAVVDPVRDDHLGDAGAGGQSRAGRGVRGRKTSWTPGSAASRVEDGRRGCPPPPGCGSGPWSPAAAGAP